MFWFKTPKIHVDCFTMFGAIAKMYPVKKATNFYPEWWKSLSAKYELYSLNGVKHKRGTMKICSGFLDLYQHGLIIPMWSDLAIEMRETSYNYHIALSTSGDDLVTHPVQQHGDSFKNLVHIKMNSPWIFEEKTGVEFLFAGCPWSTLPLIPKMHVVHGVVNYKYQTSVNINTFWLTDNTPYTVEMEAGMPLAHVIPLSDKNAVPHIHVISEGEYKNKARGGIATKFAGSYLSRFKKLYNDGN